MERYTLGALEQMGLVTMGRGKIISRRAMQAMPGDYPVYSSSASGDGEIGRYGDFMFDDERITWSIDGGGKFFFRSGIRYSVTNVGGWIHTESPRLLPKFLYHVLAAQWEGKHFDYVKKALPGVIRTEYTVPLPPAETQRKIADILDTFRALIDTLGEELEGRKIQLDALRTRLLTGEKIPLSHVAELVDCPHTTPEWQESGVPVIRNFNLRDGKIQCERLFFVSEEEYRLRIRRAEPAPGDLLFSREAPVGNVGIVPEGFRCCQGQRVVLLRPRREKILPEYLAQAMQSAGVLGQIRRAQTGSTVANLTLADMKKLGIPVPDLKIQQKILENLEPLLELTADILPAEIAGREAQLRAVRDRIIPE